MSTGAHTGRRVVRDATRARLCGGIPQGELAGWFAPDGDRVRRLGQRATVGRVTIEGAPSKSGQLQAPRVPRRQVRQATGTCRRQHVCSSQPWWRRRWWQRRRYVEQGLCRNEPGADQPAAQSGRFAVPAAVGAGAASIAVRWGGLNGGQGWWAETADHARANVRYGQDPNVPNSMMLVSPPRPRRRNRAKPHASLASSPTAPPPPPPPPPTGTWPEQPPPPVLVLPQGSGRRRARVAPHVPFPPPFETSVNGQPPPGAVPWR